MRNDKEYALSQGIRDVDHARRRLLLRIVIAGAMIIGIGVFLSNKYSHVAETDLGREGLLWGIAIVISVELFFFLAYVAFAYTPIFKVMPKGEIYRPRNWGKNLKKNREAA